MAQKYLEVYQNGKVTTSFATSSIDSVGLTGNSIQDRKVNFYRDGKVLNNYLVSSVDSIKVFRSNEEQLVYLGIIGFNQELYEKQFDVLATSTSNIYQSFVNALPRKDGTLLYYAVDKALDALTAYDFKTPINNVTLVTFTDGLDQGSLMMNNSYTTDDQYLEAVSKRIGNTKVKGLPITAYSIGLLGNDVTNKALFYKNLNKLASSSGKAFQASSMYDVETRLKEISDQIINISNRQTFSLKIPGQSNGTIIRFTFDGSSSESSTMYIEGTFNLATRSLTNVKYHGIKATTGSFVQGTQDGIFVTFTFTGMQREDGVGLIPTYNTREYYKTVGSNTWQRNSEFTPNNNTQTTITHSGAVILLVLDCSNSLGSQFSNMCAYANDFISRVANNTSKFEVLKPTNVKAFIPDDDFVVKVTWDAVKHAESYDVYRSSSSSSNFTKVAEGVTSTSWIDEKPLSGNNYYRVYAVGHGLTSQASNTSYAVDYRLKAPTNIKVSFADDDFVIKLSWNAVKHAESYDVYRNSSTSSSGFTKVAEGVISTSWIDNKPLVGNNYYKVCAVGHGLRSDYSNYSGINYSLDYPKNVNAFIPDDDFVIKVSWDSVKYAESYVVGRSSTSSGSLTIVAKNVTSTSWIDDNPNRGNNYYAVYAEGHGTESEYWSKMSEGVNYSLSAPSNVTANIPDNDFVIHVSWDAVKHAECYDVYRSSSTSSSLFTKVAEGVTSTSWVDENPLSGNNYYRVYAVSRGITSTVSNTSSVVSYALDAPSNVTANIPDDVFVIHVSWDAVKHAESYDVYRNSSTSSSGFTKVAEGVTSTLWVDEKPLSGNNYYRVYAVSHGITSTVSNTSSVVSYALDAPTNVSASLDDNDFIINMSWDVVKHAENYDVYRSSSPSSGFTKVAGGVTSTSWVDKTPLSGHNYYRVCAVGHGLESSYATSNVVSVKYELDTPMNITVSLDDDAFVIKVSWEAVKRGESYDVYRSSSPSSGFTKVAKGVTSTSWVDKTPLSGNNFYYVCAVGHGLTSPSSETSNAVNYALDAPTNVSASLDDNDFIINVSWDAVKHAENYDVYRSSSPSSGFTKVAGGVTFTSWVDKTPLSGNNYYYVCAVGHGLTSSRSATILISLPNVSAMPIDLGLPSGTKWAPYNVGATKPEEYGGYYAWGETEEKKVYSEDTYKYYQNGSYVSLSIDICGTEYDVAHVKWGGDWCMPTRDDIRELLDYCNKKWMSFNGVWGMKFTSKINGNSIFLPAAGYRWRGALYGAGEDGYYWSSTQVPGYSDDAYYLYFRSGIAGWGSGIRDLGLSVRPVARN